MQYSSFSTIRCRAVKLASYGGILAVCLGAGAAVGAAFGPEPSTDSEPPVHDGGHTDGAAPEVEPHSAGLAISQDGYTLDLRTPVVEAGQPVELELAIEGPDGKAVTEFDVEHEKELHLVIVGRDLADYAHVHHPRCDDQGRWRVTAPPLQAGSHRVYADFVPAGGEGLTLSADLDVPGDHRPSPRRESSDTTTVDGYEVRFDGDLVAGTTSELTLTITRDGAPVTDLHPYLGALGHLVAIRDGDLAYLHVHLLNDAVGTRGPEVRFAVEVPTAGRYALFFDFAHGDEVRTASVIADASEGHADG